MRRPCVVSGSEKCFSPGRRARFFQKGARRLYEMPIFCHHQSCFLQNRKTMPFVGRLVAGLLWPFGRPRQSPTRLAEPSAKACPEDPCKTPKDFAQLLQVLAKAIAPECPQDLAKTPLEFPKKLGEAPQATCMTSPRLGATKRHARILPSTPSILKDYTKNSLRSSPSFRQQLARSPKDTPTKLSNIALRIWGLGLSKAVVQQCPQDSARTWPRFPR